jgi:hypothetical protein
VRGRRGLRRRVGDDRERVLHVLLIRCEGDVRAHDLVRADAAAEALVDAHACEQLPDEVGVVLGRDPAVQGLVDGRLTHVDRGRLLLHREGALDVRERVRELAVVVGDGERVVRHARGGAGAEHGDELIKYRLEPRVGVGVTVEAAGLEGGPGASRRRRRRGCSPRRAPQSRDVNIGRGGRRRAQ